MSGGSGTAFSTYIRTAAGGGGVRSLRHVLDDAGKTVDCLRHVLFDVVAGTVFSTLSLVLGGSRTIFSVSAVIPGSGRARDSLHFQHVNSEAKRAGDSFQQHHGYRGSHRPPFVSALGPGNYLWFSTDLSSTMFSVGQTLKYEYVGIPVPTYSENTVFQFRIHSIFAECEGAR